MLLLALPWLLLLLPLPLIAARLLPAYNAERPALWAPWYARVVALLPKQGGKPINLPGNHRATRLFAWMSWILLVLALARPQYLEAPLTRTVPTRDLLLIVDLSGSMDARDFTNPEGERIDRLSAVKGVLDEFLTRREGDRVGLIVFGSAAFVQVPFTQDLNACRILLEETTVRMAGPRTVFGDALGLGITLFERSEVEERVIIALTDGNDTGSRVPPAEAAKIANDNTVKVHVVGVGDPTTTGEDVLDEEALNAVASTTGGRYFHANNREELEDIYTELDRIDSREVETESVRPRRDLFHWPLTAMLLLGFVEASLQLSRKEDRGE
ncbi:von Willebrand factor type A [Coraliomargarita akajimensis DSM 45221]|uniref:von Willebrand factor type A n=2 Tax=Coraliomargarita TaxID=442430 RepID=D5EM48_CORAD|nr:von Willebrand factor type A [Coraliomargarita akajimensis DSM 45221]